MNRLPYVDEHSRQIAAPAEEVWPALLDTLRQGLPYVPGWLAAAWGLDHRSRSGSWEQDVAVGDTLPGFAAAEIEPGRVLTLRGRHRFSDYELRFELEPFAAGGTVLRAITHAAFPGLKGRLYRALVIESGGHRIAVGRILGAVGSRARGSTLPALDSLEAHVR